VYQRGLVEAAADGEVADGLVFGLSQRDAHNVRALEDRLGYFLELVFEIGHIVPLPEGRQFLDRVGRR